MQKNQINICFTFGEIWSCCSVAMKMFPFLFQFNSNSIRFVHVCSAFVHKTEKKMSPKLQQILISGFLHVEAQKSRTQKHFEFRKLMR